MKRCLVVVLLALSVCGSIPAQTIDENDVFAPFVSRIRVAVRDPQVRLTWRDSIDLGSGAYEVYRSTQVIDSDSFEDAKLIATVEPGAETYLDTPLQAGEYYYAVLARDGAGRLYDIFVPYRNITTGGVTVEQLETEEDLAASIYDIRASVEEGSVLVRFEASRTGRTLAAYRSTSPIESIGDLAGATRVSEFESATRRFVDYPVPGVPYYYGVYDAALIERGTAQLALGENTLESPIEIRLTNATSVIDVKVPPATGRRVPLPALYLTTAIDSSIALARNETAQTGQVMSPAAERALERMISDAPPVQPVVARTIILPEDRANDHQGARRSLAQVLTGEFSDGDYNEAVGLFRNLLRLPLSDETERRVRFYLGQALFFSGQPEAAFLEFLTARKGALYPYANAWVDGLLTGNYQVAG